MALSIPPNKMLLLGVLGVGAMLLSRRTQASAPGTPSRAASTWPYFLSPSAASGAVSAAPALGGAFSTLMQTLGMNGTSNSDYLGVPTSADRAAVRAGDTYYTDGPAADATVDGSAPVLPADLASWMG
jgi:hypothetical protein